MFELTAKEWTILIVGLGASIPITMIANWAQTTLARMFESSRIRLDARKKIKDQADLALMMEFKTRRRDVYLWAVTNAILIVTYIGVACITLILSNTVLSMAIGKYGFVDKMSDLPLEALQWNVIVIAGLVATVILGVMASRQFASFTRISGRYNKFEEFRKAVEGTKSDGN